MSNKLDEIDEIFSGLFYDDYFCNSDDLKLAKVKLLALKKKWQDEARIDELNMANRLNEQKELDPVINPHTPYRMRAWFKDRINQLNGDK